MAELSYSNLKAEILDDFYIEMINHAHRSEVSYERIVMGYLSYDYEEGFSSLENIMIDFILYVISGKNFISEVISNNLRKKIESYIENKSIFDLLRKLNEDDKVSLLHDLYLVGIIDKNTEERIRDET